MLSLASEKSNAPDGERLAALAGVERLLNKHGAALSDLHVSAPAQPSTDSRLPSAAEILAKFDHALTAKERDFLHNVARARRPLSPKQAEWLRAIAERVAGGAA